MHSIVVTPEHGTAVETRNVEIPCGCALPLEHETLELRSRRTHLACEQRKRWPANGYHRKILTVGRRNAPRGDVLASVSQAARRRVERTTTTWPHARPGSPPRPAHEPRRTPRRPSGG